MLRLLPLVKGEGREGEAWVIEDIGGRPYFEDAHSLVIHSSGESANILGGIFDGHSGSAVAKYAAGRFPLAFRGFVDSGMSPEKALENSFLAIDREMVDETSGAVAVAFLLHGVELFIANCGDAELLLVSKNRCMILTELHRVSNEAERMRIIKAGGEIDGSYAMNPDGQGLQCTRSLGDHEFKEIGVIPRPYVHSMRLGADDLWLVAACDGLWDVMRPREVATIARKFGTARAVAEALANEAVKVRRTPDNITIMVTKADTGLVSSKA